MLRQVVDSSSVRSIGYDKTARKLEVEFRSGAIYVYVDVPLARWLELRDAPSKGKYFQESIRDHFAFDRLGPANGQVDR